MHNTSRRTAPHYVDPGRAKAAANAAKRVRNAENARVARLLRIIEMVTPYRTNVRRSGVPIKRWGKNTSMRVNLKKNSASGRWIVKNRNAVLTRYGLNSARLNVRNNNTNQPTVHYNEWTAREARNMPMLRFK